MQKFLSLLFMLSHLIYAQNTGPLYIRIADLECNPQRTCRPHLIDKYGMQEKATSIGHLIKLTLLPEGRELAVDLHVPNPENKQCTSAVAGVFESIQWGMPGLSDSRVFMSLLVSHKNKAIIQEALCLSQQECSIAAEWLIYDFDPDKGCYYKRFHTCGHPVTLRINGTVEIRSDAYGAPEEAANRIALDLNISPVSPDEAFGFAFCADGKQFKHALALSKDNKRIEPIACD